MDLTVKKIFAQLLDEFFSFEQNAEANIKNELAAQHPSLASVCFHRGEAFGYSCGVAIVEGLMRGGNFLTEAEICEIKEKHGRISKKEDGNGSDNVH